MKNDFSSLWVQSFLKNLSVFCTLFSIFTFNRCHCVSLRKKTSFAQYLFLNRINVLTGEKFKYFEIKYIILTIFYRIQYLFQIISIDDQMTLLLISSNFNQNYDGTNNTFKYEKRFCIVWINNMFGKL